MGSYEFDTMTMKRIWPIFALLCLAPLAWGTAYTSVASGNWNSSATWSPAAIPGSGDTVTLANGYTVTVPGSYTATVSGISCSSSSGTGILIVNGTLDYKGSTLSQCTATWVCNSCTLTADDGSTTIPWNIGYATCTSSPCALLIMNGTYASPVTVNGTGGSSWSFGNGTYQDSGQIQAIYANFTSCGTASVPCIDTNSFYYVGLHSSITYSSFTSCGEITFGGEQSGTGAQFIFNNNTIVSPLNSSNYGLEFGGIAGDSTWVCQVENNYLEGETHESIGGTSGLDDGCIVNGNWFVGNTTTTEPYIGSTVAHAANHFDGNAFYNQQIGSAGSGFPSGPMTRSLLLLAGNPGSISTHLVCGGIGEYSAGTYNGGVYEREYNDPSGIEGASSCLLAGGGFPVTVENYISVPSPDGYSPADLINVVGTPAAGAYITAVHNTSLATPAANGGFATFVGEGSTGQAGQFQKIADNIFWMTPATSGAAFGVNWFSGTPVANNFEDVGNNDWWNVTGTAYTSLYGPASTPYNPTAGTYGNGDITQNPGFVGCPPYGGGANSINNCNFKNWGKLQNITVSTWADILTQAKCMNAPIGSCLLTPSAILAYYSFVQDGFRPTNAALHNTASDGTDIGAVKYLTAAAAPSTISGLLTGSADLTCVGVVPCSTWPMPANPGFGNSYVDPTWGTTTWQLAVPSQNTSGHDIVIYSRVQGFSSDSHYLFMGEPSGTAYLDLYDATTTPPTPINRITTTDGTLISSLWGDANWANTVPTRIYYIPFGGAHAMELRYVDVSTCTTGSCVLTPTLVHTFSATTDNDFNLGQITGCSVNGSNVVTVQTSPFGNAGNGLTVGQTVVPSLLTQGCSFLNNVSLTVASVDPSYKYYTANLTHATLGSTTDSGITGVAGLSANQLETGSGAQGGMFDSTDNYFSFSADVSNGLGRGEVDLVSYNKSTNTTFQEKWYKVCSGAVPSGCGAFATPFGFYQGYSMMRMNQHPDYHYITVLWHCPTSPAFTIGCGTQAYDPSYNFLGPISLGEVHQDNGFDVNGIPVWVGEQPFTGLTNSVGTYPDYYSLEVTNLTTLSTTSITSRVLQFPCGYAYAGSSVPCGNPFLQAKASRAHISMTGTWGTTPGYALVSNMIVAGSSSGYNVDWPLATTLGTAVTSAGSHTVSPASMANIGVGTQQLIDYGSANIETVTVTGVTGSTFTATFANTHLSTAPVSNLTAGDTGPYAMENTAVKIDTTAPNGSAASVIRLGRAMSIRDADYNAEPHTFVGRNWNAYCWESNWNTDNGVDNGYCTMLGGLAPTSAPATMQGIGSIQGTAVIQ